MLTYGSTVCLFLSGVDLKGNGVRETLEGHAGPGCLFEFMGEGNGHGSAELAFRVELYSDGSLLPPGQRGGGIDTGMDRFPHHPPFQSISCRINAAGNK